MDTTHASAAHTTPTNNENVCQVCSECRCQSGVPLTVAQTADLPVMRNISASTLYRLVQTGAFVVRTPSDRRTLIYVTQRCVVHGYKETDDIDLWLAAMRGVGEENAEAARKRTNAA